MSSGVAEGRVKRISSRRRGFCGQHRAVLISTSVQLEQRTHLESKEARMRVSALPDMRAMMQQRN